MRNLPTVTKNLLIINVLCFFAYIVAGRRGVDLNDILGLHFFLASDFKVYQLFTYMFMHANFGHIFFNMFAVWMFGRILETAWGPKKFLLFYIICGLGAGFTQEVVQYIQYSVDLSHYTQVNLGGMVISMGQYLNKLTTVGASGAIYGVLLAFGMMFPNERLFIIPFPFPIKAKCLIIGYFVLELGLGLANTAGDSVAHFAHLGGMLFGLILILYWRKKNKNNNGFSHY